MGQVLRSDPGPGVPDREPDPRPDAAGLDRNRAAIRRVPDRVVEQGAECLAEPIDVAPDDQSGRHLETQGDARRLRPSGECPDRAPREVVEGDGRDPERQVARLGESDGPQVVDDPGEQAGLVADRQEMPVVVVVDAVEDGHGGGIDDREGGLELVDDVLEEPPASRLRPLQVVGHRIERAAERTDLVGPVAEARASAELAVGDRRGGDAETVEGFGDPAREQEAEQRGAGRRRDRDRDQGDGRLLLDLLGVDPGKWSRAAPTSLAGAGGGSRLDLGEAATDDHRCRQGDRRSRDERDEGERRREPEAQAHGRAAR